MMVVMADDAFNTLNPGIDKLNCDTSLKLRMYSCFLEMRGPFDRLRVTTLMFCVRHALSCAFFVSLMIVQSKVILPLSGSAIPVAVFHLSQKGHRA